MNALLAAVLAFNRERSWDRYHDPRSTVIAICSETAELVHLFRWRRSSSRRLSMSVHAAVSAEVTDILISSLLVWPAWYRPDAAIHEKLRSNASKYPVSRS